MPPAIALGNTFRLTLSIIAFCRRVSLIIILTLQANACSSPVAQQAILTFMGVPVLQLANLMPLEGLGENGYQRIHTHINKRDNWKLADHQVVLVLFAIPSLK